MNRLLLTTAALLIATSAAYAGDPGYPGTIERGTLSQGFPYVYPWVCDATAKPPKPGRKPRTCKF